MHAYRGEGGGSFWTRYRQGVRGLDKVKEIRLAIIQIRSRRAGGMEAALRALRQGNVDVGVLQ